MENFLNTSFSNSNANLSRPKTMKEKPNWEVKANLLLTPGWCAWTGWNTVRLWWEGGFEGGWESVGRSAGVSALRWVVLPWEGCVALPSAPQGSLLVSLQGLWHGGRGARVCVWESVRACVRWCGEELDSTGVGEFPVASWGTKGTDTSSALLFSERVREKAGWVFFVELGSLSLSERTWSLMGTPAFSAWSCFGSVKTNWVWGLPSASGLRLMLGYSQGKLFLSFEWGSSVV